MKPPRGLSAEEAAAWAQVAATVTRLRPSYQHKAPARPPEASAAQQPAEAIAPPDLATLLANPKPPRSPARMPRPAPFPAPSAGLDSHWDRRFRAGAVAPDFTLDLHGCTLDQAHRRLDHGLAQARAMGARVVLLIAGKPRPAEHADRGGQRGAIRAKLLDWLAAGPHGSAIAAIRKAHPRHGGEGALYVVLRRAR